MPGVGGASPGSGGVAMGGTNLGGTQTGGTSSGGSATGGAMSTCYGTVVNTLPTQGACCGMATSCPGEPPIGTSLCDASGNRCICARGVWWCDNSCPASEPTSNTACQPNAFCTYRSGVACACIDPLPPEEPWPPDASPPVDPPPAWMCAGVSSCPDGASPLTGDRCSLAGMVCDYPDPANPSNPHMTCFCTAGNDAGLATTWTCLQSSRCETNQPAYGTVCNGPAMCAYSTAPQHCLCAQVGSPWICF